VEDIYYYAYLSNGDHLTVIIAGEYQQLFLSNLLLSRPTAYVNEIVGDHQYGF
jgi:hypothetical protein